MLTADDRYLLLQSYSSTRTLLLVNGTATDARRSLRYGCVFGISNRRQSERELEIQIYHRRKYECTKTYHLSNKFKPTTRNTVSYRTQKQNKTKIQVKMYFFETPNHQHHGAAELFLNICACAVQLGGTECAAFWRAIICKVLADFWKGDRGYNV